MYLRKLGVRKMTQDYVFNQSGLNPELGRGSYSRELNIALKKIGFNTGRVWYRIPVRTASKSLESEWRKLHADLMRGIPSIVCMHYSSRPKTTEHFRLILGYNSMKDQIIYHEPALSRGAYLRMNRKLFLKLWPLKYRKKTWTVVRFRLKKKRLKAIPKASATFTNADYAQHIMKLKKKIPSGFTYVLQRPFIVVGDESPVRVKQRALGTVKWATDKLKKRYFKKDPRSIITIWLFKNKKSYRKYTWQLFNDRPSTPYGYFSKRHNTLIMNIATGGGTLVHEMVHPFIDSNFPGCPSWFNEGLASLYEQCGSRNGRIVGFTNWRLAGLQRAIKKRLLPSFKTLMATSTTEFYNQDPGTNYAQARYLCYYLQQRNLLRKFYHLFARNFRTDPTGYNTLKKVLRVKNMTAFQKRWEKYILKLRYQ